MAYFPDVLNGALLLLAGSAGSQRHYVNVNVYDMKKTNVGIFSVKDLECSVPLAFPNVTQNSDFNQNWI